MWPKWQENPVLFVVILLLVLSGGLFFLAEAHESVKIASEVGKPDPNQRIITVQGEGRAVAAPDIANVSFGVETRGDAVDVIQDENAETMNNLLARIKNLDIPEDDIQTSNYSVYEDRRYNPQTGEQESRGWIVNQRVEVKVRDTDLVSDVLTVAGQFGATNISGPHFTIDDTSNLLDDAREDAIADAKENADRLAKQLGVKLGDVVGYQEGSFGNYPQPLYARAEAFSLDEAGVTSPAIEPGSEEVRLNVTITYEIR